MISKEEKRKKKSSFSFFSFPLFFLLFVHQDLEEETIIISNVIRPIEDRSLKEHRFSHDRRAFHQREEKGEGGRRFRLLSNSFREYLVEGEAFSLSRPSRKRGIFGEHLALPIHLGNEGRRGEEGERERKDARNLEIARERIGYRAGIDFSILLAGLSRNEIRSSSRKGFPRVLLGRRVAKREG